MTDISRDKRLQELLELYVEQRVVQDVIPDPRELCRDQPELFEPLLECVREYEALERMLSPDGEAGGTRLAAGRRLLHYRVLDKIGEGGMGEVYLAEDTRLGRRVALKVLPPEMAEDGERLERFHREARAVAALNHPNVVTLHSVEEAAGVHFLTMELIEGTTLADEITPEGMSLDKLFSLAIPIADALAAAHRRGILHRDLKPANVMVDAEGVVKILDFGLAKHIADPEAAGAGPESVMALTGAGQIFGTVPYMSPEQLAGKAADGRSDIFALGVILYEMATGRRPFQGDCSAELISSILRDEPVPVTELNPDLPRHFGRIVRHCLEKSPDRRLQSARDLRNELAGLRREVESGEVLPVSATILQREASEGRSRRWAGALLVAATATAVLLWQPWDSQDRTGVGGHAGLRPAGEAVAGIAGSPSALLVHDFENLSGDPELDWLRHGLREMLVTDLSQSAELEVVGLGRLAEILEKEIGSAATPPSREQIRTLAERGVLQTVVRGSYARAGGVLRIDFKLVEAGSGKILESGAFAERDLAELFGMVDEISASIRNRLEVPPSPEAPATVAAVTTSSLEAWRYFSEANRLHSQSKRAEAIALLEKAVEIDPGFALALSNLGRYHVDLGHDTKARDYARRAFDQIERIPLDLREEVAAVYYTTSWRTLGRAVELYREALLRYPGRLHLRNNLANRLAELERYQEAVREYRRVLDDGSTFVGNYTYLANTYAGLGRFETGYRILADAARRRPDDWWLEFGLGWHLSEWGKLDEALSHFERATALRPADPLTPYGRWRARVLQQDWREAEREAGRLREVEDSWSRWRGAVSAARNATYRGFGERALELLDEAVEAQPGSALAALAHCWKAEVLLARGEAARALVETERARDLGRENWPELAGIFLASLASQQAGDPSAARRLERELRDRRSDPPNAIEERQGYRLAGLLALAEGDFETARRELERAEALLPPQGVEFHWHVYPDHVAIWHDLGRVELAAGRLRDAARWFRRAVTSDAEHLESPLPWVRSFYFLGHVHRRLGELGEARRDYQRFLELWRDGDLDRERVSEALSVMAANR